MNNSEIRSLIKKRRLQMLVHSCIYYELDESVISDHQWQSWADELAELIQKYPDLNRKIDQFDQYFSDWDGSSGFNLPHLNPWVLGKATGVLEYSRGNLNYTK